MMQQVYISYFYQIRFFTPAYLPISTAVWDPKWYHENQGHKYKFRDKNGVLNGVRSQFLPPNSSCNGLCRGRETCPTQNPVLCQFIQAYKAQLKTIDLDSMLNNIEIYLKRVNALYPVFIVHEAPYNPCSERVPLMQWFRDNGISCQEWSQDLLYRKE